MALNIYGNLFRNSRHIGNILVRKNFGTNLKWETNLERGLQKIVSRQKPGMIVVHKSWCGACRNLKPKFEASKDIQNLSGGFVLISLSDDNHPKDLKYMPDGDYVPRIMFINPQGSLLVEVINQDGSTEYKYFYSDAESIARSMKHVLNQYPDRWFSTNKRSLTDCAKFIGKIFARF